VYGHILEEQEYLRIVDIDKHTENLCVENEAFQLRILFQHFEILAILVRICDAGLDFHAVPCESPELYIKVGNKV